MTRNLDIENRIQWIDWMKAILMLLIVWGHFFPPHVSKYIYAVNVPLFFFSSGYLQKPIDTWKQWWSKQWRTLLMPYLLLSVIRLIIYFGCNSDELSFVSVSKSVCLVLGGWHSYGAIPGCGELWFVYALFVARLLYQIMHQYPIVHGVLTGMLFVFAGWYGKASHYGLDLWSVQTLPLIYPVFYLGTCKSVKRILGNEYVWWKLLLAILCALPTFYYATRGQGAAMVFIANYGANYGHYILGVLCGIVIVFTLSCLMTRCVFVYKPIYVVSIGTLFILAFHYKIIELIKDYQLCISGNYIIDSLLFSMLIIIASIPCIMLVMKYIPWIIGRSRK